MLNKELLENVSSFKDLYANARPYSHALIDGFMNPKILDIVLDELQEFKNWEYDDEAHTMIHQVNKFYIPASNHKAAESLAVFSRDCPITLSVLNYLYSEQVTNFLTELTGIPNLKRDTMWLGAGAHKVCNGGKLDVHADFNLNWKTGLYRRINLLLYLSKDWKDEYGGHLELWERDLSKCAGKILPTFNRAVIFNTMRDSYHGHPHPITCPDNTARYSLALYYYSDVPHENEDKDFRTVTWKNV
jgi:Rps23 Pro-64 3,4-dihydroxylase Tpa1-like proline 4-hydroxylase